MYLRTGRTINQVFFFRSSVQGEDSQRLNKMPRSLRSWEAYSDLKKKLEDFDVTDLTLDLSQLLRKFGLGHILRILQDEEIDMTTLSMLNSEVRLILT